MGGNFESFEGPDDLAILENKELLPVGEGLIGSFTTVSTMEVYQGELYIAGLIPVSQGNIANHILRWDGTTFNTVGDTLYYIPGQLSTSGGVSYLKQNDGYLYIAGGFRYIGDNPIYKVARWDGSKWCGMFTQEFDQNLAFEQHVSAMGFFEDQMIIVHPYVYEDDTYDLFWIYEGGDQVSGCTEPVGVEEVAKPTIAVFPNPATNWVTIQSERVLESIVVADVLGKTVLTEQPRENRLKINLECFHPGLYFIRMDTGKGSRVARLVIQ